MVARLSQETFIERSIAKHGELYDYSKVVFKGTRTPVEIVCQIHGSFLQQPAVHMNGSGCPAKECRYGSMIKEKEVDPRSTEVFDFSKGYPELIRYHKHWGEFGGRSFKAHREFYDALVEQTAFIQPNKNSPPTPSIRMYAVYNDIHSTPPCKECGEQVSWGQYAGTSEYRFNMFCSSLCANRSPETNEKRFAGGFFLQSEEGKAVMRKAAVEKAREMGLENPESYTWGSMLPGNREKAKETYERRTGYTNSMHNPESVDKLKKTNLEKFGHEVASKSDGVKLKIRNTNLERYGYATFLQSPEGKEKSKESAILRYGAPHPMQSDVVREAMRRTSMERYGKAFPAQQHISDEVLDILASEAEMTALYDTYGFYEPIANFLSVSYSTVQRAFALLGFEPTNHKRTSVCELEVRKFIESLGVDVESNRRNILNGKELDIYIPSKQVAIEFNGLYWHSSKFKDRKDHQNKSIECMNLGIQLIHVWEDDWKHRRSVVESKIRSKLGFSGRRVFARKTKVLHVSPTDAAKFMESNHVQGKTGATEWIGLECDGELVACMGFRITKEPGVWDLVRYATSCSVVGGMSKIISHFKKNFEWKEIFTYAHLDYSHGKSYEAVGFEFSHVTVPGMWYFNGSDQRIRREIYMKHKLPKYFDDVDMSKTEREILAERGIVPIYDAGSIKYVMKNPS